MHTVAPCITAMQTGALLCRRNSVPTPHPPHASSFHTPARCYLGVSCGKERFGGRSNHADFFLAHAAHGARLGQSGCPDGS